MFGNGLLKRGCLAFVMLFGLTFLVQLEDVNASGFAVTSDGCFTLQAGPGGFNAGPPQSYDYTGAVGCDSPVLTTLLSDDIVPVNATSSIITSNPPSTGFTGTLTGTYTAVAIQPLFPINYATVIPPTGCKDFFGQTNDNPVQNQGVIDFDNEAPAGDLRTCLELSSDPFPAGEIHYDIDGWAWNTNLGWVSTTAIDLGSGPENRGLSVGSQEFRSELKVGSTYRGDGELFGYWWNDAVGWIKLNCAADTSLNPGDVAQCAANGGADYQVYVDSFDPVTNRAVLAGYAWTDSMGYIDFTGVEMTVPGLSTTYDARVTYEKINTGQVYANGENGYIIKVSIFDNGTNVTDEFADSRLRNGFCLEYEDKRVLDSLSETPSLVSSPFGTTPVYTCGAAGSDRSLVDDPSMNQLGWDALPNGGLMQGNTDRFAYNSTQKAFVLRTDIIDNNIKSFIPTSTNEEFDLVSVRFFNDISGLTKLDTVPQENGGLIFNAPHDLKITGSQNPTSSTCRDSGIELEFDSPVKAAVCGDYFRGNLSSDLRSSIVGEPNVNALYADRFDSISAVVTDTGVPFENVPVSQNGFGFENMDITLELAQGVSANALNPLKSLMNLEVSSSVSYTVDGQTIRREGPSISNESQNIFELNIQGGLADRSFGSTAFSSGAKDTQGVNQGLEVKERVYRVLRNILQMENKPGRCGVVPFEKFGLKFTSETTFNREGVNEFLPNCGRVSKSGERHVVYVGSTEADGNFVAYSELRSLVENEFSTEGKAPVVVLYGVDLIVDDNIVPNSVQRAISDGRDVTDLGDGLNEVPGFVVIETEDGYGGDVIVSANVTDVVSYIYADGRMMSAPSVGIAIAAAQGNPDVVLNRSVIDEEALFNQFSLLGALYSTNCIGCASNIPPLRADGSVAETRQLSLIEDLNAFRYTPLSFNIKSDTIGVPLRDDFGFEVLDSNGQPVLVQEPYTCLVPCGQSASSFSPLDGNGQFVNECRNIESKITAENACFDTERYKASGPNQLSDIEESIAELSSPSGSSGVRQYDLVIDEGLDESSIRSVNIRSLEIPEGMPVFGVITR